MGAWSTFGKAYAMAVESMQAQTAEWSTLDPTFDVIGAARKLDWSTHGSAVAAALKAAAYPVARKALTNTLAEEGSRLAKQQDFYPVEVGGVSTSDLAEQLTIDWVDHRALAQVTRMSQRATKAAEGVLQEGVQRGWTVETVARKLRTVVGLSDKDAAALSRFKDNLEKKGANGTTVIQRTAAYRRQLIRQRASTIARTEIQAAKNMGQLNAWRVMQHVGELATTSGKEWVPDSRACGGCLGLSAAGPVRLNQPFSGQGYEAQSPPLHPNCGCGMRLVRNVPA